MRFPFESKLLNYVSSWYQIQNKPRSGQRRFHGAHTARIAASCGIRTQKARKGTSPCGPLPAHAARLRTSPRARNRASIEKRPPRARRPALPQPRAAVLSAKAGLTAGFGMGPGDPRLCGRARGGRSPAASRWSLPGTPVRGDPGGRMAGTDRRSRIALGALIEDAKSSGY